jgi:hypothetical protein
VFLRGKPVNAQGYALATLSDVSAVYFRPRGSAEQLGLKAGDNVKAVIKATEVLIDMT